MRVLGLHKDPWHNTGAAALRNDRGTLELAYLAEERLDRVKDSRAFPELSVKACLEQVGLKSPTQVDLVVLDYICNPDPLQDQFRTPCRTDTFLNDIPKEKIHVINHHLAHAAAVFYSSLFKESAVLIVDGRGSDKETQSLFVADAKGIRLVASTTAIGIGLLYAGVTHAIGFGLLQEGKTMGLAPYGSEIHAPILPIRKHYDGIVTDYSDICIDGSYELKSLLRPIKTFEDKARAAFEVQQECEQAMLHLAAWAKQKTGMDNLCISGGVALNSVANYKILQAGIFKDVFINPAASDTGIPLGCALYGYHELLGGKHEAKGISAYLGPAYDQEKFQHVLDDAGDIQVLDKNAAHEAAKLLAQNYIIGCCRGRSEMGPRSLGNRSILMSPLRAENKDILNSRVKFREAFRPFAPAVLEEHTQEYFEIDRECPFMLFVPNVKKEKRNIIPAVTHVDGTARLQTVSKEQNPHFYEIIEAFYKLTGVPVLLNTSFNVAGEPIVETPEHALRCMLGTDIDGLLFEDKLVVKPYVFAQVYATG
jgi:carbamoyltransferase